MRYIAALFIILSLSGCSSSILDSARFKHVHGQSAQAAEILDNCEQSAARNRLLCLMEKGSILFSMEQYQESTTFLLKAARLMKEQEQISILDQSSAIIINDQTTEYKGEYAERLWVHTLLMMNFILQSKFENAQVEAKQALELFDTYPNALKEDFFSRALIALCFENMAKWDSARIEYAKLSESSGAELPPFFQLDENNFEAILFIRQGFIPQKISRDVAIPPSVRISLPDYQWHEPPQQLEITTESTIPELTITTDLGSVVKTSLQKRVTEYVTRQALRVGTKEALAQAAGEYDALAEILVRIVLFMAEQADTRSWQTLPGGLTLARIPLKTGAHTITIEKDSGSRIQLDVTGEAGQRIYFNLEL